MREPYQWYVLYVRANTEKRVISDILRFIETKRFEFDFDVFCPESEYYYRGDKTGPLGKPYRKRPLFPGYVFIETEMPPKEFLRQFGTYAYGAHDIIRILGTGDSEGIALSKEERIRLEFLLKDKRCVEHSVGYIVGDAVTVEQGPLKGYEGLITYINRHNRFADIEMDMFGGKVKARVALEIVNKTVER
ncbi:MAG: antitermination protein NusG [Clostridiales bacterium]|nr:antitermination protein NusG [Clostridiales bacterium]